MEWRARLHRSAGEDRDPPALGLFSSLDIDIKSQGTVFGKPGWSLLRCDGCFKLKLCVGTIARRISIHRATTVGPKSPLFQVVLKNTSVVRDPPNNSSATLSINRSHSLLTTTSRLPILAPSRGERARLEAILSDVWSREILPFPGMTTRSRSEHLVRTSASSVMRKLSVASITSSFNKRTVSAAQKTAGHQETPKCSDSKSKPGHDDDAATVAAATLLASAGDNDFETTRRTKRPRTDNTEARPRPEAPGFELTEVSGTVRRLDTSEAKTPPETGEISLMGIPILRTASTNSLRLSASTISEKSPRCSMEKENRCRSPHAKGRGHGRWARVGMTKHDGKGHGFRSLFR